MRTIILLVATIGVVVAFRAIGDVFLVVFVGIFLAFVFENPVHFVMAKTRMSRGLAATITVLGTALAVLGLLLVLLVPLASSVRDFLQDLPAVVDDLRESDELLASPRNVQEGAEEISLSIPDAISALLGIAGSFFGVFLGCFTILFICLFLLPTWEPEALAGQRPSAGGGRALAQVWDHVTETISRWAIGVVVIAAIAGTMQGTTMAPGIEATPSRSASSPACST